MTEENKYPIYDARDRLIIALCQMMMLKEYGKDIDRCGDLALVKEVANTLQLPKKDKPIWQINDHALAWAATHTAPVPPINYRALAEELRSKETARMQDDHVDTLNKWHDTLNELHQVREALKVAIGEADKWYRATTMRNGKLGVLDEYRDLVK